MRKTKLSFAVIPPWTFEGKTPGKYTFFEAIALAELENKPLRLDTATQRALLGSSVFGKRLIVVDGSGFVTCSVSLAFGLDFDEATYSANVIQEAINQHKQLRPGTTGRRFLSQGMQNG